jgi:class 3 adenylate cyclase
MRCPKCDTENRESAKFCDKCGARLLLSCAACGAENRPDAKFCGECGASLNVALSAPALSTKAGHVAERRHLTVLLCDLVGSTALAAQLDPEEWRETVAGYQRAATDAITRFDGYVARYVGDGVLAFFGYPEAHDNDAERAVRASLALLTALDQLNQESGHTKLSARIGIDSGAVVVGGGTGQEADVFGDAPNIAARVQAEAAPGTVAISAATQRLVAGLFIVEELSAQALKGIEQRV